MFGIKLPGEKIGGSLIIEVFTDFDTKQEGKSLNSTSPKKKGCLQKTKSSDEIE